MARVLVIGDTHAPAMHPAYIPFLKTIANKWDINRVVHIGDVVDHHCISFHPKHPESEGALMEYEMAKKQIQKMYEAFPKADVTIGNHDKRIERLAGTVNIPGLYLKPYKELYDTKGWNWVDSVEIDDVFYYHGTGAPSNNPGFNAAKARMQSTVIGHFHSFSGVSYVAGPKTKIWGMSVGCGVDRNHLSMGYTEPHLKKPLLGCGVVIEGHPYLETMDL
jgi:predicted phosphodiesterase